MAENEKINEAIGFHQAGRLDEAEKLYLEILSQNPQEESEKASVLNLLGLLKYQKKDYQNAVLLIKNAIEITPCSYFYENLGRVLSDFGDEDNAVVAYENALKIQPDNPEIWFNLGLCYKRGGRIEEAIASYKNAIFIKQDFADAYYNLGNISEQQNDTASAVYYYKKTLEYKPQDDEATYFLANACLKVKNFEEGWKYFEGRPSRQCAILTQGITFKEKIVNTPLWDGKPCDTILVYYEAGFGDTVMFARYIPLLKKYCKRILFKPQVDLKSLFEDSFPDVEIVSHDANIDSVKFDRHIPVMSLPALIDTVDDIPFSDKYLKANDKKVKTYKEKYFDNSLFKIGIKWQGNLDGDRNRIIKLDAFRKLFSLEKVKFYSLQKDCDSEMQDFKENLPEDFEITDLSNTFKDFSDTAAAIENLDLVICNDTSVAHLAGALGKPCWILLPFVQNWRWHTDLSFSPWYDSVKLFKQDETKNWDEVMARVYRELRKINKIN